MILNFLIKTIKICPRGCSEGLRPRGEVLNCRQFDSLIQFSTGIGGFKMAVLSLTASDTILRNAAQSCGLLSAAKTLAASEAVEIFTDSGPGERCAFAEAEATVSGYRVTYHFFCEDYPHGPWGYDEISRVKENQFGSQREAMEWFDRSVMGFQD